MVTPDLRAIEAIDERTGRIVGMVGYNLWTKNSVNVHVAAESPSVWRSLLAPGFKCGFGYVEVLLGVVYGDNAKSQRFARKLGFKETHRVKDGAAKGVDLVLFEMRKNECRYLHG